MSRLTGYNMRFTFQPWPICYKYYKETLTEQEKSSNKAHEGGLLVPLFKTGETTVIGGVLTIREFGVMEPFAIIIGAGKCGTRALLEFLTIHPYIVTANSEVHFFDLDENFKKGFLWYKSHMPLSFSNQITIEKTPSYIWSERAAHEIYKLNKNMKLILIVKDPVVRVISQAIRSSPENPEAMFIREHDDVLRIANESHTVDWGVYVKYIKMWLKVFPRSQLHIIESSQFITDPASEIQKLEQFLGIPRMITDKNFYYNQSKGFYCMRPFHTDAIICLSSGKGIPHPKINPIFEKLLYAYYSPHNEELFKLLGRKYDWRSKSE
ncbi:Heparan sulfate glucosamine 3-O-sulfotransferase 5 [Bulinus truncatus]|nr:Heparan sulfate glucosamine 3-O-sulfotransferase 5 [Bulinus truncatus]